MPFPSRWKCRLPAAASPNWCGIIRISTSKNATAPSPLESYAALRRATEHCRARKGPALIHAHVIRPYSHSLSDDEKLYKCETERSAEAQRDPLPKFALFLVREGILEESEIEALEAEVDREIIAATDRALAAELPSPDSIYKWVYSPDVDPTSRDFEANPKKEGHPKTMVEMVSITLLDEMKRDERIVVFGEDVADCSREESLSTGKREGWRLQSHGRPAAQIRRAARVQFTSGRSAISSAARSAWPFAG